MTQQQGNFVIITQPRSGSYYFKSLLDSAEDIICQGEIFKKNRVEIDCCYAEQLGFSKDGVSERNSTPFAFVKQLRMLCAADKIFGFKAFWPHLEPHKPLMHKIIHNPEWKKIFLVRNPLQTYASLLRANKTKVWVKKTSKPMAGEDWYTKAAVHFDDESFAKHLTIYRRVMKKNSQLMQSQPESCLEIGYSEVANADKLAIVLKFLGSTASPGQLTSEYQKQYRGDLLTGFDNADELMVFLEQHDLMAMAASGQDVFVES